MMSQPGIDLRTLIQSSTSYAQPTDELENLDVGMDEDVIVDILKGLGESPAQADKHNDPAQPSSIHAEGAKVWMAASKFVTPAYAAAWTLTSDKDKAGSLVKEILGGSAKSAFDSVIDAYSCGADFNKDRMFGVYRYSLASASNCISAFTYLNKLIVPSFPQKLLAHVYELATGYRPLSERTTVDETNEYVGIHSAKNTASINDKLRRFCSGDYPTSSYSSATLIKVSLFNAITRFQNNVSLRASRLVEAKTSNDLIMIGIINGITEWVSLSQNTQNGGVLAKAEEMTTVYAIQNALNMVTAVCCASVDKLTSDGLHVTYGERFLTNFDKENTVLYQQIIKTINQYASAFIKAKDDVKTNVINRAGVIDRPATTTISLSGWLSLAELPSKIAVASASRINDSGSFNMNDMIDAADSILRHGFHLATEICEKMQIWENWAYKAIALDCVEYMANLDRSDIELSTIQVDNIVQNIDFGKDYLLEQCGFKLLLAGEQGSVDVFQSIKAFMVKQVLRYDAELTGHVGSKYKHQAIEKLIGLCNEATVSSFKNLESENSNDEKIMLLGSIVSGLSGVIQNSIRIGYNNPELYLSSEIIVDIANKKGFFINISETVRETGRRGAIAVNHGCEKLTAQIYYSTASLKKDVEKKPEAVTEIQTVTHSSPVAAFR